jgi:hypothetical protein
MIRFTVSVSCADFGLLRVNSSRSPSNQPAWSLLDLCREMQTSAMAKQILPATPLMVSHSETARDSPLGWESAKAG